MVSRSMSFRVAGLFTVSLSRGLLRSLCLDINTCFTGKLAAAILIIESSSGKLVEFFTGILKLDVCVCEKIRESWLCCIICCMGFQCDFFYLPTIMGIESHELRTPSAVSFSCLKEDLESVIYFGTSSLLSPLLKLLWAVSSRLLFGSAVPFFASLPRLSIRSWPKSVRSSFLLLWESIGGFWINVKDGFLVTDLTMERRYCFTRRTVDPICTSYSFD